MWNGDREEEGGREEGRDIVVYSSLKLTHVRPLYMEYIEKGNFLACTFLSY